MFLAPYFNDAVLRNEPLSLIAYFALIGCFVICYLTKNPWLRFGFFFSTLLVAFLAGRIDEKGIACSLIFCLVMYYGLRTPQKEWGNLFFLIAFFVAAALAFKKMPGFYNWPVISKVVISKDAIPYSMTFTFDKSLIGLFFISFSSFSLAQAGNFLPTLKAGAQMGLLATLGLIPLSWGLGYVAFDLKFAPFFGLWALNNLFFVCFAEEAVFRGMLQPFLMIKLQSYRYGQGIALVVAAILFGLAHYQGGVKYVLLAFIAGLFYGYAFMKTQKIEASILTHFMVNALHFLAFTYPALKSAF